MTEEHAQGPPSREPRTQLITGMHAAHTTWRLLRWLLFLAALLSMVCGGFLLAMKTADVQHEYQTLKVEKVDKEVFSSFAVGVANAFRQYWILLVIIFAAVFTFFELFIHSRWKIYVIYALIAIGAWVFVLYSMSVLNLPIEELRKGLSGGQ